MSTADSSHRPRPAMRVSSLCISGASSLDVTAAIPPCALNELLSLTSACKSEATMEDIEELARFLESSVDEGKTTFVVTGESQAIYDNKYPYVGYGIAEVSYSKYFGTLNFTYCNVTEIIEADLAECKSLKTLKLPYVTSCAKNAFNNCSHLEKIIFGSVVTFVGEDAFEKVDNYVDGGCELVLNKEQVNVEGLSPDLTNKTWAGHTWKSITLTHTGACDECKANQ